MPGDEPDDPEDRDPGLAQERTSLAWTRTAISFAVVGGVVLKNHLLPGLLILCASPAVWHIGHLAHHLQGRLRLVTATVVAVSLVALAVAVWP
jgi:uncharacterized membrane protein YidH (DUF202 family)